MKIKKKQYIKPISTIYNINLKESLLNYTSTNLPGLDISDEWDDEDSRQAREYNTITTSTTNIWEEW